MLLWSLFSFARREGIRATHKNNSEKLRDFQNLSVFETQVIQWSWQERRLEREEGTGPKQEECGLEPARASPGQGVHVRKLTRAAAGEQRPGPETGRCCCRDWTLTPSPLGRLQRAQMVSVPTSDTETLASPRGSLTLIHLHLHIPIFKWATKQHEGSWSPHTAWPLQERNLRRPARARCRTTTAFRADG